MIYINGSVPNMNTEAIGSHATLISSPLKTSFCTKTIQKYAKAKMAKKTESSLL